MNYINKTIKFWFAPILILSILSSCTPKTKAISENKPNVIFIMVDDMGASDLGCYGADLFETKNIDKLGREGMTFSNAYCSAPVCSPTRSSFMTGKPPVSTGITEHIRGGGPFKLTEKHAVVPPENGKGLSLNETTIAEALKKAGYQTAIVGKWHLGGEEYHASQQGFDHVVAANHKGGPGSYFYPYRNTKPDLLYEEDKEEYLTDRITDEAISFIHQKRNKPFFLYLSYYAVHTPLQPKKELHKKYKQKIKDTKPQYHKNPKYASMVETLDTNVGRLIETLDKQGLRENTLIILTSDNGGLSVNEGTVVPATNNFPCRDGKGYLYEGGIKVPLIINWKGKVKAGSKSDALVSTYDYFTTITSVCGVKKEMPNSEDISPVFLSDIAQKQRALYWHFPHYSPQGGQPSTAIRDGKYKLIYNYHTGEQELYNLEADKSEQNNLIEKLPEVRKSLENKLNKWLKESNAKIPTPNPLYKKPVKL